MAPHTPQRSDRRGEAVALLDTPTGSSRQDEGTPAGCKKVQMRGGARRPHARRTLCTLSARKSILEADPPYGARVTFEPEGAGGGWNAPAMSPWLLTAVDRASGAYFGKPAMYQGTGGSIPFMSMLGEKNAHGPNEFLDLPTGAKLTACVAHVLAEHHAHAPAGG